MDYISQMEKVFKFLELNLEIREIQLLLYIKKRFNNDLNLFGCFIKDFIIVNTAKVPDDKALYSEFVLLFEKNSAKENIELLDKYSQCYLMIVFEDCDNLDILEAINTANACFTMEIYPVLMKILYNYYYKKVNIANLQAVLESIKDLTIEKSTVAQNETLDYNSILNDLSQNIQEERLIS